MLRSVGFRTFVICLLAIAIVGGAAAVSVYWALRGEAQGDAARAMLESAYRAYATLETERYERLAWIARHLGETPEVQALTVLAAEPETPETGDDAEPPPELEAVRAVLAAAAAELGEGMAAVLDLDGEPLATTGDVPQPSTLTSTEAVGRATQRVSRRGDSGVWLVDGRLHYLAVEPVVRDFERLGLVAAMLPVDELTAEEMRPSRGEVVFLTASPRGVDPVTGTLPDDAAVSVLDRLGPELIQQGGFGRVLEQGESIDRISVDLADQTLTALLAPVRPSSEGGTGAAVLLLAPATRSHALGWETLLILAAAGALALLLAACLAWASGRAVDRSAKRFGEALEAGRRGDFEAARDLAPASGVWAAPASRLHEWVRELQQERELRETVADAVSADDEDAKAQDQATREEVALLGVELRRYARSTDAERAVERFQADLGRIRSALRDRGGRVEAVSGHRILAGFLGVDAEDRALAALAAALEIRRVSTRPTSAFDEPEELEPPTLVLASGRVVSGTAPLGVGGRLALGLPVQMLETLLREAAPGQILMSRDVRRALSERLEQAGVDPVSQRGMLTPQPLFELSPEAAAEVTGVGSPEGEVLAGFQTGAAARGRPEPGQVLGDRFEIRERVGAGPLATVYRAYDREFGRAVAFKAFRREALREPGRLEDLDSPLAALRGLAHPHVARTYDFGVAGGVPFLSRRLVPGLSLRRLVERSGALSVAAALGAGRQMASGLAAAHRGELFHGRLKPENVIFETHGSALLTDFGCVFLAPPGLDLDGSSAAYLAPEQEHGEPGDARTDVYAWGLLVYDLVTGRIPALGETVERRGEEADVPEAFQEVLRRCLSPEPDRRYPDGGALLDALTDLSE